FSEKRNILGIKIYRDRSKRLIGLSQSAYIDKILKKFNMHNSKKGYLPMEVKHELSNEMCASTPEEHDTKSQMGYIFVVNGGAVDWKSKKQTTIVMSATQAEYMAASEAAMEAVWIRKFVGDLGVMPSIKKPINMYYDNSAAIIFGQ
ncbi:hypothetical protein Tco_0983601, partial [Tanacetum coccineum]